MALAVFLLPRRWTAWESNTPPRKLLGTEAESDNIDIPERGKWVLAWPLYFAFTTRTGWHLRIGIRYDFVDRYYTWPAFTVKHLT